MSADELYFIDTNLLVYKHDARDSEKQRRAERWLDQLWDLRSGRLSWQVLHEFYVVATTKIGAPPRVIRSLVELYAEWTPVEPSVEVVRRAWYWLDKAGVSYWDGLILAAAERAGCRWLLSEDFQHGRRYGAVQVINPFQSDPEAMVR